jgi:hypothetical protein
VPFLTATLFAASYPASRRLDRELTTVSNPFANDHNFTAPAQ